MKKTTCPYLLSVLFFLPVLAWAQLVALLNPSPLPQVNLLQNGSFERAVVSGIPCWSDHTAYGTRAVESGSTRCGKNVLRMTDSSAIYGSGLISDAVAIESGVSYTAEAYIKRTDSAHNIASIYLKYFNTANEEIAGRSVLSDAADNVWDYKTVTFQAPAGAVTVKVMCYSTAASTGTLYFDGVSLRVTPSVTDQLIRYVSSAGTGDGASSATAAKYNSASFWSGVKADLVANQVKVVFLEGDYLINNSADDLVLKNIGHAENLLTLEGERPYGSVFTRNNAATDTALTVVSLQYATNIVFRHLHWEDDTTDANKTTPYHFTIRSGSGGAQTRDITVEGCSFVGLNRNVYGALGIHHKMTHDVEVSNCEFIRGGNSSGFHMIYNAYGPYNLCFRNNYFQDCAGVYLRLRGGTHDAMVASNAFISTSSSCNQAFVEVATFNDVDPGDETWGYNLVITGNSFRYVSAYNDAAVQLYHKGFDPSREPGGIWNYLLTTAKKSTLLYGSSADKELILKNDYGLVSGTNLALTVTGNQRIGTQAYKVTMESWSGYSYTDTNGVLHVCPDYGGNGQYNLSDVFPN